MGKLKVLGFVLVSFLFSPLVLAHFVCSSYYDGGTSLILIENGRFQLATPSVNGLNYDLFGNKLAANFNPRSGTIYTTLRKDVSFSKQIGESDWEPTFEVVIQNESSLKTADYINGEGIDRVGLRIYLNRLRPEVGNERTYHANLFIDRTDLERETHDFLCWIYSEVDADLPILVERGEVKDLSQKTKPANFPTIRQLTNNKFE